MFTTPLLGVLRRAYPNARIDFAVGSHARAAIEANPIIDNRIDSGKVGQGRYTLLDIFKLIRTLRATHYDAIFVPDRSRLLSLIALLSGIKIRVGLRGNFYTHRVESNVLKHEAELYLDLARAIDLDTHRGCRHLHPARRRSKDRSLPIKRQQNFRQGIRFDSRRRRKKSGHDHE